MFKWVMRRERKLGGKIKYKERIKYVRILLIAKNRFDLIVLIFLK